MSKHKNITFRSKSEKHYLPTKKIRRKRRTPSAVKTVPVVTISEEPIKFPRKRRTKNVSRMYFTQDTENAIILYNSTEDVKTREDIFNTRILYPFQNLVENVLNTFKFSYFETGPQDVQKECLTHLVSNMHKFDPSRYSKANPKKKTTAFAYFSIIAKHFLILLNNTNYKEFNRKVEIGEDYDENIIQLQQADKYYAKQELTDFIHLIINFWEKNANKIFIKQRDLIIANAVVEIIRGGENISLYNKKALYLYIREIADCRYSTNNQGYKQNETYL